MDCWNQQHLFSSIPIHPDTPLQLVLLYRATNNVAESGPAPVRQPRLARKSPKSGAAAFAPEQRRFPLEEEILLHRPVPDSPECHCKDAPSRAHSLEQCQREPLQIRRKDKQHGIGQEFFELRQQCVNGRLEVFRSHRGQADEAHVSGLSWCEISSAVYGDVVTRVREPAADFLVVSLDPAVLADDAPRSDENSQCAGLAPNCSPSAYR
jgi:hypothetical protein